MSRISSTAVVRVLFIFMSLVSSAASAASQENAQKPPPAQSPPPKIASPTIVTPPASQPADQEQGVETDPPALNVKMTQPAGGLWQTPVRWVPPTRGPVLPSLYVSLIGLEAYDGYSTTRALKHGAIESNSLMSRLAANPYALWALKGGTAIVSIYTAERLWRKNRRGQAIVLMVASNVLMAAVAVNNASILRAQK